MLTRLGYSEQLIRILYSFQIQSISFSDTLENDTCVKDLCGVNESISISSVEKRVAFYSEAPK